MDYGKSERADPLAAQYVLGTMRGRARERFAKLAQADHRVGRAVREWEERLVPFADTLPPIEPSPRVWQAILARIQRGGAPEISSRSFWGTLGFWRGLAIAGLASALVLGVALFTPKEEAGTGYVAVLAGSDQKPALVASADREGRFITISAVGVGNIAADRSLQLWALPPSGNPRSLGLVPAKGVIRLKLPVQEAGRLDAVPKLAVSLEPQGGSPTGLPTGPVLYSGALQRLY